MDFWKHGRYLDGWSVVHFLSGFVLGCLFYWLGLGFPSAFIASLACLFAWEGFEAAIKIIEPSPNVFVDVIVGILGFFLAAHLYFFGGAPFSPVLCFIALAATVILSFLGFRDYLKRGYR